MLAKTAIEFAIRPEGWIHSIQGGFDVPRGPVGVLFYLVFIPLFAAVPRRWRAHYLTATSLCSRGDGGPAFTLTMAGLALAVLPIVACECDARTGRALCCWSALTPR